MRRLCIVSCAVLLLVAAVSCEFNGDLFRGVEGNPFLENAYDIELRAGEETPRFVVVTDVHLGRESNDDGTRRYDGAFKTFLESETGHRSALVSLGDFVDEANIGRASSAGFVRTFAPYCSGRYIGVIGNHETHVSSMEDWESSIPMQGGVEVYTKRMAVYRFEDVSLYVMDNAKRIFGSMQLDYLEAALEKDSNPVKIVLAHENVFTGRKLDQSLVVFGNCSATEIARFSRILRENGVSLVLTGHTHNGGIVYSYGEGRGGGCYEMNLAAYHGYESSFDLEGKGNWYVVGVDGASREIVVETYAAATALKVSENRFGY